MTLILKPDQKDNPFMRRILLIASIATILIALTACNSSEAHSETEPAVATETYPITGTIISRIEAKNQIRTDHDAIPDFMEAMTMNYEVRGAQLADLPPNGSRFKATLHVSDDGYWLTDVVAE
jgi:protein SCO1